MESDESSICIARIRRYCISCDEALLPPRLKYVYDSTRSNISLSHDDLHVVYWCQRFSPSLRLSSTTRRIWIFKSDNRVTIHWTNGVSENSQI